jgi:hypothetical protein
MLFNATHDFYLAYLKDDPVRPHIPAEFRIKKPNQVWVLEDDFSGKVDAIICVAYTNAVPTTEQELADFCDKDGDIAVFYTVWSYTKGAGRDIVFGVASRIKRTKRISRYVTLSPRTEMARKFHLGNGAVVLQENSESVNYEYLEV